MKYQFLKPLAYMSATFCIMIAGMFTVMAARALPPALLEQGWEEITFDGKTPNEFTLCDDNCISVISDNSVSMLGRPIEADLTQTPYLRWNWRVENPIPGTDLTAKGQDDRAVAVYVTFAYDPDTATIGEMLARPMVELLHGANAPGRVISYVWAGYGQQGDVVKSPYFGDNNVMVICRTGADPVGEWVSERFDVAGDHQRIYGSPPTQVAHVLIASDSDDTRSRMQAQVRNLGFTVD